MSDVVLQIDRASVRRSGTPILSDVSLTVRAGEHWVLLGPNGAGKSTILALAGAAVHPSSGTVTVLGKQLGRVDVQELRRAIGHVNPRHTSLGEITVEELVWSGITGSPNLPPRWKPTQTQATDAQAAIEAFGLQKQRQKNWSDLSQGERQRALIARALVIKPSLLLLDEPNTGLDISGREELVTVLNDLPETFPDITSVLVTHYLEEIPPRTTHAAIVTSGRISAEGRIEDVLTSENVSDAFGHPMSVSQDHGRWHARLGHRLVIQAFTATKHDP